MKTFTLSEVIALSQPLAITRSGIYILIKDSIPVYVGQSFYVDQRCAESFKRHSCAGRVADCCTIIPCPREDLDEMERAYIAICDPAWNDDPITRKMRGLKGSSWRKGPAPHKGYKTRPILTPDGEFRTLMEAARHFGISGQAIWEKADRQSPGWKFKDDPIKAKKPRGRPRKPLDK